MAGFFCVFGLFFPVLRSSSGPRKISLLPPRFFLFSLSLVPANPHLLRSLLQQQVAGNANHCRWHTSWLDCSGLSGPVPVRLSAIISATPQKNKACPAVFPQCTKKAPFPSRGRGKVTVKRPGRTSRILNSRFRGGCGVMARCTTGKRRERLSGPATKARTASRSCAWKVGDTFLLTYYKSMILLSQGI